MVLCWVTDFSLFVVVIFSIILLAMALYKIKVKMAKNAKKLRDAQIKDINIKMRTGLITIHVIMIVLFAFASVA